MPNAHTMARHLLFSACLFSIAACTSNLKASPPPAALAPLLGSISERLTLADQVALTKWDSGKPIQDSPREQQVIAAAARLAPGYKLDADDVSRFLAAQIEANKLVQYALIANWHAAGKAPDSARPDLATQIRPRLDQLQVQLLQDYAAFAPYRQAPDCPEWLGQQRARLTKDTVHDLALVRATGELCIQTK
jgi:chorismate mutase